MRKVARSKLLLTGVREHIGSKLQASNPRLLPDQPSICGESQRKKDTNIGSRLRWPVHRYILIRFCSLNKRHAQLSGEIQGDRKRRECFVCAVHIIAIDMLFGWEWSRVSSVSVSVRHMLTSQPKQLIAYGLMFKDSGV